MIPVFSYNDSSRSIWELAWVSLVTNLCTTFMPIMLLLCQWVFKKLKEFIEEMYKNSRLTYMEKIKKISVNISSEVLQSTKENVSIIFTLTCYCYFHFPILGKYFNMRCATPSKYQPYGFICYQFLVHVDPNSNFNLMCRSQFYYLVTFTFLYNINWNWHWIYYYCYIKNVYYLNLNKILTKKNNSLWENEASIFLFHHMKNF